MAVVDELRAMPLFDGLTGEQLVELVTAGREAVLEEGEVAWNEGSPADVWWVLLDGTVELVKRVGKQDVVVGAMSEPGQWAGGFAAWDPHGLCFATGRAASRSRVLRVPADELRRLGDDWFAFGVHFIRGLVQTVRRVESTARQREALVALGTLAAGLAHEINNPASAAVRAVGSLQTSSDALVAALLRLTAAGATPEQVAKVDALRRGVVAPERGLDPLDAADREDELSGWLSSHGVEQEWLLAPVLAAAGVDGAWCDRLTDLLGPVAVAPGVEWVAHTLTIASLHAQVTDATQRISGLVAAVRSYAQLDRAAVQEIDLTEGLESTLVMLSSKLQGVTVERHHAPEVPRIEAIPAELNQVWTNLIDNAVDAMDGTGVLRLSTRLDDAGRVVVEVEDSGPGMPAEVQARIFDPFFTTKDVGKGTGLGLDISRRIIEERHAGELSVESVPGRTVMRVVLPVHAVA